MAGSSNLPPDSLGDPIRVRDDDDEHRPHYTDKTPVCNSRGTNELGPKRLEAVGHQLITGNGEFWESWCRERSYRSRLG